MKASTSRSLWMNRAAMTFLCPEARVIGGVAALRSGGLKGSNETLNALARMVMPNEPMAGDRHRPGSRGPGRDPVATRRSWLAVAWSSSLTAGLPLPLRWPASAWPGTAAASCGGTGSPRCGLPALRGFHRV
jgi:hypothetical protein